MVFKRNPNSAKLEPLDKEKIKEEENSKKAISQATLYSGWVLSWVLSGCIQAGMHLLLSLFVYFTMHNAHCTLHITHCITKKTYIQPLYVYV